MGSSGGTPVTQQTTQTKDPWAVAQPALGEIITQAQGTYNADVGYQPYPYNTTANLQNAYTTPGMQNMYNLAISEPQGSAALQAARQAGTTSLQNYGLSPELQNVYNEASSAQNPYLQGVINQQVGQANAAASGMGRYGSGAHDAAIAQAIAPTLSADYARRQQERQSILEGGLQRQGQWAQVMPALDEARYANAGRLLGLGDMQRSYEQALIDQQVKLWNAQQARPWEQLARKAALVQGAGQLGGTQITTSPGATQPSTLQRLLGGGLAGAGLGASIGGAPGAGIGAIGGGLLGLL